MSSTSTSSSYTSSMHPRKKRRFSVPKKAPKHGHRSSGENSKFAFHRSYSTLIILVVLVETTVKVFQRFPSNNSKKSDVVSIWTSISYCQNRYTPHPNFLNHIILPTQAVQQIGLRLRWLTYFEAKVVDLLSWLHCTAGILKYLQASMYYYPDLVPQLLACQTRICQYACRLPIYSNRLVRCCI